MINPKVYKANGKLLITGEYLVMEGAEALAVPLNKGQSLKITTEKANNHPKLFWNALTPSGFWFNAEFLLPSLHVIATSDREKALLLKRIFETVRSQNPGFLKNDNNVIVETILDFSPEYGFGSSSTLITNIARWANVNPFDLQFDVFGGSAYDIACAIANNPLVYKLVNGKPEYNAVIFDPGYADNLYFVYLGKKQNSAQGIKYFKKQSRFSVSDIDTITELTRNLISAPDLKTFSQLIDEHEKIMSRILKLPTVKESFFNDIEGSVKSLGAWGGDFVLFAVKNNDEKFINNLKNKGFSVIFAWHSLVKNP